MTISQALPVQESADHGTQYRETWFPERAAREGSTPIRLGAGSEFNVGHIKVPIGPTWSIHGKVEGEMTHGPKVSEVSCIRDQSVEETVGYSGPAVQPDGSFVCGPLFGGDYILTITSLENGVASLMGSGRVSVVDKDVVTTIQVGVSGAVNGRVEVDSGNREEFSDLEAAVEAANQNVSYVSGLDTKGNFDIRNIVPGSYSLNVIRKLRGANITYPEKITCSGNDYTRKQFTLGTGAILDNCEVSLSHATGSVSGSVKSGGVPQPGLTVVLIPQSREARVLSRNTFNGKTDATAVIGY